MRSEYDTLINIIINLILLYYIMSHIFIFYCAGAIVFSIYCIILYFLAENNPKIVILLHGGLVCYYLAKNHLLVYNIIIRYINYIRYWIIIIHFKIILANFIVIKYQILVFCRLNYNIFVILLLWEKIISYTMLCFLFYDIESIHFLICLLVIFLICFCVFLFVL